MTLDAAAPLDILTRQGDGKKDIRHTPILSASDSCSFRYIDEIATMLQLSVSVVGVWMSLTVLLWVHAELRTILQLR